MLTLHGHGCWEWAHSHAAISGMDMASREQLPLEPKMHLDLAKMPCIAQGGGCRIAK